MSKPRQAGMQKKENRPLMSSFPSIPAGYHKSGFFLKTLG